jgi:hypothetical protein
MAALRPILTTPSQLWEQGEIAVPTPTSLSKSSHLTQKDVNSDVLSLAGCVTVSFASIPPIYK